MKYNLTTYQSDNKENPGFFATGAVRGAARGRSDDLLILSVLPNADTDYWQEHLGRLAQEAVKGFYRSPGSVTNAMRGVAEALNRELRLQNSGIRLDKRPESAGLIIGVLRESDLYIGQAGYGSALLVSGAGTKFFFDEEQGTQNLGLSNLVNLRFFKTAFHGSDYLLMGLPKTLQAFEAAGPLPNSVIRLVNEIEDLPSAFSLSKITLGDGMVENRLLSLAMLLDEAKEEEATKAEEMAEDLPQADVVEEPQVEAEYSQASLFDEISSETLEDEEVMSFSSADELNEVSSELEEKNALSDEAEMLIEEDLIEDEADDSELIIDLIADLNDPQPDSDDDEFPEGFEYKTQPPVEPEDSDATEDESETDIQEAVLARTDTFETPETEAFEAEANVSEPEKLEEVYQEEAVEVLSDEFSPDYQAETALKLEQAAIERQERLERLKKGALTGIARGVGWLRGIEENAELILQQNEQKPNLTGEEQAGLSPFAKWAIVFLVPLLVVAVAVSIYFARGLDRQYVYFVNQARAEMKLVPYTQDNTQKRQAYVQAILWLNQARDFNQGDNSEIISLRNQAQAGLDQLDGVKRLHFKNAFGKTTYADLNISHLVPGTHSIFALDQNSGKVYRFYKTGDTYLPDNKFNCGPGDYGEITVGKLIDITDIPVTNPNNAAVLGIDAEGNVLYCSDSGKAQVAAKLIAPAKGLGSIDAIHYGNDGLYILDTVTNNIWVYRGMSEGFPYEPGSYLDEDDADLQGAIDLVVRREGLFVLYRDGRIVLGNIPVFAGFEEAQLDGATPLLSSTRYTQISALPVADNLLYLLEAIEPAIVRSTYRLVFSDVLKVSFGEEATPGIPASAIAISNAQIAFIAFENQLFYAQLP